MHSISKALVVATVFCGTAISLPTLAVAQQGRVEMEIGTAPDFNQLQVRDWYQLLTDLKVANLRITAARGDDKVEIITAGSERAPVYRVKGHLTASGQLILPGGRFTVRNRSGLSKWISNLAEHGPGGPKEDTTGMTFGLDDEQLKTVYKDLAEKVNFSTVGMSRPEIVTKIAERLDYEVSISSASKSALQSAGDASFELKDMTCGTALAYTLRAAGLGMVPRAAAGGFSYQVAPADAAKQTWPIGLPTKERAYKLIPKSREFVDFQVNPNTPLTTALPPIAEFLETSFLFDENLMVAAEIDPSQTLVKMDPKKITLTIAASRLLGQARLRSELRLDEDGRPFYWITPLVIPRDR